MFVIAINQFGESATIHQSPGNRAEHCCPRRLMTRQPPRGEAFTPPHRPARTFPASSAQRRASQRGLSNEVRTVLHSAPSSQH